MTQPKVTLHDVTVTGDAGDRESLLAAIEDAVARATGTPGTDVPAQVGTAVEQGIQR